MRSRRSTATLLIQKPSEEVLPQGELSLAGLDSTAIGETSPEALQKDRTARASLAGHYHMCTAQLTRCTNVQYLPEGVYRLYDGVNKDCEICQGTKPGPPTEAPRSRFSVVRAKYLLAMFSLWTTVRSSTWLRSFHLFLVPEGEARSLLWGATQQEGTEPLVTQDLFTRMDAYSLLQAEVGSSRYGLLHSFTG